MTASAFAAAFSFVVDPEFPGDGQWDVPVFNFDRDGLVRDSFESRWGTPFIVRVEPFVAPSWVGCFPSGGLGGVRLATECPAPTQLCVIADGLAYVVDVEHPDRGASTPANTVTQVVPLSQPPLLLLARFSEIVALGPVGTAWESDRVFVDDIAIAHASEEAIVCTGYNFGGSPTVSLDPKTGDLIDGTALRDLGWPE